jgi:hypothetical protein
MLLVLFRSEPEMAIGPDTATRLAALGVSSVSLLRDEEMTGLVLDGWAFDPARSAGEALSILREWGIGRLLHPVMHLAVRP